ncbi:MAG: TrpB-like pyridoxal phosphate-dependent enzyme, partial [Actinobacteria bacterium]|nr:TrpB-like pyridoxal phosphate-dependent enzyme [Actinomycetota bacterium]
MTAAPVVPIPDRWLNVNAAYPQLAEPYLDPTTRAAIGSTELEQLFAPELVEQEMDTTHRYLPIPEEVLRRYAGWRPTPLLRAVDLERALETRCRIFYKYEGASPIGSHKANSGVAQAYFSARSGRTRLYAETGAGQWGSAISMGAGFNGLQCDVFMVGNSYDSKPSRRVLMETFGSTVRRSPTTATESGRAELARDPDSPGSLGLAIAEAIEATREDPRAAYALGSAFGFVCMHQTVIGQELRSQLTAMGATADVLISCIGGGSSFAGLVFPFLGEVLEGSGPDLLAVESDAVPTATQGLFAYDHGDSAGLTPLIKMYTLGHGFAPPSIHAGGLRYHGLASQVSKLLNLGLARAEAYPQLEVFQAAALFARTEGLVPAPEAAHSVAAACAYARRHREQERTVVFCMTGHGFFDLAAYERFKNGDMQDSSTPTAEIAQSLAQLNRPGMSTNGVTQAPRSDVVASRGPAFNSWQARHFPDRVGADQAEKPTQVVADVSQLRVVTERVVRD